MQRPDVTGVQADINVTPLVDVVLVLLIIFMLITPMLPMERPVDLPTTENPPTRPDEPGKISLTIEKDGFIWLDREKMSAEALAQRLHEIAGTRADSAVVINGDGRLTFGDVKRVMLVVKDAGFMNVGLIAEKREGS